MVFKGSRSPRCETSRSHLALSSFRSNRNNQFFVRLVSIKAVTSLSILYFLAFCPTLWQDPIEVSFPARNEPPSPSWVISLLESHPSPGCRLCLFQKSRPVRLQAMDFSLKTGWTSDLTLAAFVLILIALKPLVTKYIARAGINHESFGNKKVILDTLAFNGVF